MLSQVFPCKPLDLGEASLFASVSGHSATGDNVHLVLSSVATHGKETKLHATLCSVAASKVDPISHCQDEPKITLPSAQQETKVCVCIIGAGFSGASASFIEWVLIICAGLVSAVHIRDLADVAPADMLLIERNSDVGGTWFCNRYPGCMSDVEALAYLPLLERFTDEYMPSRKYVPQKEILEHARRIARKFGLLQHIWFESFMHGACWKDLDSTWNIQVSHKGKNTVVLAQHLILAAGRLTTPNIPRMVGIDSFAGNILHTSEWPANTGVDMMHGKRIAVIGTGASAIQVIPEIAKVAERLYVFQRHAPFVTPRLNPSLEDVKRRIEAGSLSNT